MLTRELRRLSELIAFSLGYPTVDPKTGETLPGTQWLPGGFLVCFDPIIGKTVPAPVFLDHLENTLTLPTPPNTMLVVMQTHIVSGPTSEKVVNYSALVMPFTAKALFELPHRLTYSAPDSRAAAGRAWLVWRGISPNWLPDYYNKPTDRDSESDEVLEDKLPF